MKVMLRMRRWAGLLVAAALLAGPAAAQSTDVFKGFSGKSDAPIQVDATTLEVYEEGDQRISVFTGGVTVVRGNTTMKAASIKLYSDKDGGGEAFTRMEASGTVYVNSGEQTVTGSRALVDNKAQTITLTGNVVLSRGKDVVSGERLVVDMATGRARVEETPGKAVRIMITPNTKKSGTSN